MSSNPYLAPLTERMQRLRQLGGQAFQAISHPVDTVESLLGMPIDGAPQPTGDAHEQAIQQMNQQAQAQRVQGATQSFQPKRRMPVK